MVLNNLQRILGFRQSLNKKGAFFTIIVILAVTFFILSYTFFSDLSERKSVQKRVGTLNDLVSSLEEDMQRKLFIAGFRIIFLFDKKIIETGNYIDNFNETFEELFYNGTLLGEQQEIMNGAKFPDIKTDLELKAAKLNANLSIFNQRISFAQDDPWNVRLTLSAQMIVEDRGGLVLWNRSLDSSAFIPINNFADPLYSVNTDSRVSNNFSRTPYSIFVSGDDVSNLLDHAENSYYIESDSAPSFLDRLKGVNSPNINGIESLVNLAELSSQGIQVQQKSVVDYIYFSGNNPSSCNVLPSGMPSWFRLDNAHLPRYQVNCAP